MNREELMNAGINYDQGVNRFAGNSAIYEKYLSKIFDSSLMADLKEQIEKKNYENAFRTSHDLKGTSGNLSMNTFFKAICAVVEELRSGSPGENLMELYENAESLYNLAKNVVKK